MPLFTADCPQGYTYDEDRNICVNNSGDLRIPSFIPFTTTGTSTRSDATTIYVTVVQDITNAIDIGNQVAKEIADAVAGGINEASQQAADIAKNTASIIADAMKSTASGIVDGFNSVFGRIGDVLGMVVGFLKDHLIEIGNFIKDHLGSILEKIGNTLKDIIVPIAHVVEAVARQVQEINDNFIQPITTLIIASLNTLTTLTKAIEGDLHDGLRGMLNIPTDIANGLTTLDATMQRTVQQLGITNKDVITTTLGGQKDDTIHTRLAALGKDITSVTGADKRQTTFTANVKLQEPGLAKAGAASVDAIWKEVETFVKTLLSGGQNSIDGLKSALSLVPFALGDIVELPTILTVLAAGSIAGMLPLFNFMRGDIAAKAGLEKLGGNDALNAWLRGFIDEATLEAELSFEGYDKARMQVLKDLKVFLLSVHDALDMYFRGIIDEADLRANLKDHGITKDDQDALLLHAFRKVEVGVAKTAVKWGILTQEQYVQVLKTHAYTDNEVTLALGTLYEPEDVDDVIKRLRFTSMYAGLGFSDPKFSTVPDDVIKAAQRDGVDTRVALDQWQRSFYVPSIENWIHLYFRGIRTRKELWAAFDYYMVPEQFRDDIIQGHRALIPWRTVPRLLAANIVSEEYARKHLMSHGYDLQAAEALLGFARDVGSGVSHKASGDIHAQSVSNAKQLWEHGAFTDKQYEDVLIAHGYDAAHAETVVVTEKMSIHAKERKELSSDIVNEVLAGLVSIDDAQEQMTRYDFSPQEKAKVLRTIQRQQRAASKTPSEAELRKMVENDVIPVEAYRAGLSIHGYAEQWIDAFVNLYFGEKDGNQGAVGAT